MTPDILIGAIVLIPVLLLMFLRVNATLVFLSLCLGNILVQFVAADAGSFIQLFATNSSQNIPSDGGTVKLILLLLPVVLTTIFMIKTVRGHGRLLLNLLPAIGVGLLGALLVVPLLPVELSNNVTAAPLWEQVERAQNLIVGSSALACLLVLWLQRPKTGGGEKHAKHKG